VFRKETSDFSAANAAVDAAYLYSTEPADVDKYLGMVGARAAVGPVARLLGRRAANRARHAVTRVR
jgi:hypothetical protein